MSLTGQYLDRSIAIIESIRSQENRIREVAAKFAHSILDDRVVHLFGSGHSRIMVEEMWPRYGSFPGFHPIVELSLTFHNQVVGANGQRQAMFLENVTGLAERILCNFNLDERDSALVVSSSGCNLVQIEMAELMQSRGIMVAALISKEHSDRSRSKRDDGKKLGDFADIVLDTGAPAGDAMVIVPGLETPVSPGSTLGGVAVVNCIKAEVAKILTEHGRPPFVLTAPVLIGPERSAALFEKAYDEHGRLISGLYVRKHNA